MSARTQGGTERAMGPAWKSEARGQWRRDIRSGTTAGGTTTPTVLRVREARSGFSWEMWRGNTLQHQGEAPTAGAAVAAAEQVGSGTVFEAGHQDASAALAAALDRGPKAASGKAKGVVAVVVLLCWFAQLNALRLGVGSPLLIAICLVASAGLLWRMQALDA